MEYASGYTFSGKRQEVEKIKKAFLKANNYSGVSIKELSCKKAGWFKYELKIKLHSREDNNMDRFMKRVRANHDVMSGNVLGFMDFFE